ncbi:MAG TPA: GNAT family N-acetyltransferase [Chthoniobacterales bacterium]|nr:GNAT family N-acetyltransferase [Chthoniobacterales bacterium]
MPPLKVTPVVTNAERDAFIEFPWRIYKDDPAWVPPLILERRDFLNREKHPFYKHGHAALFLARRDGEIVGRIMASDDPNYNAEHGTNVGCFGLFECIDDLTVALALFAAADDWLRQRGRSEIMGPIDYSTNYVCALLIDGFEHPPMLLTSHNPPYYQQLIERSGFEKAMDWYAWWFADPAEAAARLRRIAARFSKREAITIRPVNLKKLDQESARLREIYNQAWEKNWGFVPFTGAEFDHLVHELKPLAVPELVLIAEIAGEPAGFILAVPDINAAFKKINGRLFSFGLPIGLAKLIYHKSRLKTARLVALGVVPKFRRHGIAETLVLRIVEEGMLKRGYIGELSMTLENNRLINRFLEAIGAEKYKTYRIYQRAL